MKEVYAGRRPGIVPKLLNLDRYAARLLEDLAPTPRGQAAFVAGLIYAEVARREERAKVRHLLDDPPVGVGGPHAAVQT